MLLDERSAFPDDEIAAVTAFGLQRWYIPAAHGGMLGDALVPLLMIRHLARRDFTVAAVHGKTFLGAISAWVAGGEIATRMAGLVDTGQPVSWGLTERGRGSDLSRSATSAQIGAGAVRVDGGKWPINNAVRCRAMTVLARSDERPGPRSLSLVLVDKRGGRPRLDRVRTQGRFARPARRQPRRHPVRRIRRRTRTPSSAPPGTDSRSC